MQRAAGQVELRDVVAELADVARQREALVVGELDLASLRPHAYELKGQRPCAR